MSEDESYDPEKQINLSEEALERLREITKTELFRDIMRPDLRRNVKMQLVDEKGNVLDETPLFTKELKVSYLNDFQLMYVVELTDLAYLLYRYGAIKTAKSILAYRDTLLSAAPSRNAKLLTLMNTEINIQKLETAEKKYRKWLSRGEQEYGY